MTNYLLQGEDKYIRRYPEKDIVQILKDSSYHSEEWEETDSDVAVEDDNNEETVQKKTTIIIYERWWRSPAVCIFIIYLFISFIYQKYNGNFIHLFI